MNMHLNEDFKALKRLEKILKQQIKLNNLLIENNKLREHNRNLLTENRILLNILKDIELSDNQQKQLFNIMYRKVYNA